MPKVHHLKAAKDYPDQGISKGEMYYKWSLKTGPRSGIVRRSKTYPRQSQLTTSPFRQAWCGAVEELEDALKTPEMLNMDDVKQAIDDFYSAMSDLSSECDDSYNNLPEGLQSSPTGELLESRREACDEASNAFDSIDLDGEDADIEDIVEEILSQLPEEPE